MKNCVDVIDEVLRERERENKKEEGEPCESFWSLEEVIGGKKVRVSVWRRKKRGGKKKKKKEKRKEMQYVCKGEKKREKKKKKEEGNIITIFS